MRNYSYQLFLNLPFGANERKSHAVFLEVCERSSFAEQRRSGTFSTAYKFNDYGVKSFEKAFEEHSARSAELDSEIEERDSPMPLKINNKTYRQTGLYYYGARYYNPRISNWLSVDPIALWQPVQETEHYILGQHNGGYFNPMNMSVYGYTYQNPIRYIDPNGKQVDFNRMILGVFAHRTLANDIRERDIDEKNWKAERMFTFSGLGLRPDVQYFDGKKGAVYELKPSTQMLSLSGKAQNIWYAALLTIQTGFDYTTGSTNGAPYPIKSGTILKDESGKLFKYTIPIGTDGMIYWDCMNCNKKQPQPSPDAIRHTKPEPLPDMPFFFRALDRVLAPATRLFIPPLMDYMIDPNEPMRNQDFS